MKKEIQNLELKSFNKEIPLLKNKTVLKIDNDQHFEKYSKFVVGNEVVHFNEKVCPQHKQDILNAKLLAQLHANAAAGSDTIEKTELWYKTYIKVLSALGFAVNNFGFEEIGSSSIQVRVDKVLLEFIANVALNNEIVQLASLFDALKKMSDNDHDFSIFNTSTDRMHFGKFQISNANVNKSGNTELVMSAFYTSKNDTRQTFLFVSWGSLDFKVWCSAQKVEFNHDHYDKCRELVAEKLEKYADSFIKALDI